MNEVRCQHCGKMIALRLEGELEFYCPRCERHQTIMATTAQVGVPVDTETRVLTTYARIIVRE